MANAAVPAPIQYDKKISDVQTAGLRALWMNKIPPPSTWTKEERKTEIASAACMEPFKTLKLAAIKRQLDNLITIVMVSSQVGQKLVNILDALRTPGTEPSSTHSWT